MKVVSDLHHIRKHILRTLTYTKWARYRDMKPEKVDSNLYSYHLKQLVKDGYIEHNETKGYRLSPIGLRFVDHVSLESFEQRWQPKILTMIVAVNTKDEILMWPKYKQPFIGMWSLPSGKMHYEDASVEAAAAREIAYFSSAPAEDLKHMGVVTFRASIAGELVSHTIAHIFTATVRSWTLSSERARWIKLDVLDQTELSPATSEIIKAARTAEPFFYESYDVEV